jgi:hypothetical protein
VRVAIDAGRVKPYAVVFNREPEFIAIGLKS